MQYKAETADAEKRLDKFLVERASGASRSSIQKKIKEGAVLVNGKVVPVHHFLKPGDEVSVKEPQPAILNNKTVKIKMPKIIFEDENVLVLEKPSGLLVHEAPGEEGPTLADALVAYFPKIKKVGDDPRRPGIVHRLDRDVSGLILAVKNQKAFDFFKQQFKERGIGKEYIALVYGSLPDDTGRITFKIARSVRRARMAARPESQEGKEAITEYEVVKRFSNATLIKVRIETGRTHQIRAHFHALGHPVVGDQIYKISNARIRPALNRPFLHAAKLAYTDLSGERREFESPLPADLEEYLKKLN